MSAEQPGARHMPRSMKLHGVRGPSLSLPVAAPSAPPVDGSLQVPSKKIRSTNSAVTSSSSSTLTAPTAKCPHSPTALEEELLLRLRAHSFVAELVTSAYREIVHGRPSSHPEQPQSKASLAYKETYENVCDYVLSPAPPSNPFIPVALLRTSGSDLADCAEVTKGLLSRLHAISSSPPSPSSSHPIVCVLRGCGGANLPTLTSIMSSLYKALLAFPLPSSPPASSSLAQHWLAGISDWFERASSASRHPSPSPPPYRLVLVFADLPSIPVRVLNDVLSALTTLLLFGCGGRFAVSLIAPLPTASIFPSTLTRSATSLLSVRSFTAPSMYETFDGLSSSLLLSPLSSLPLHLSAACQSWLRLDNFLDVDHSVVGYAERLVKAAGVHLASTQGSFLAFVHMPAFNKNCETLQAIRAMDAVRRTSAFQKLVEEEEDDKQHQLGGSSSAAMPAGGEPSGGATSEGGVVGLVAAPANASRDRLRLSSLKTKLKGGRDSRALLRACFDIYVLLCRRFCPAEFLKACPVSKLFEFLISRHQRYETSMEAISQGLPKETPRQLLQILARTKETLAVHVAALQPSQIAAAAIQQPGPDVFGIDCDVPHLTGAARKIDEYVVLFGEVQDSLRADATAAASATATAPDGNGAPTHVAELTLDLRDWLLSYLDDVFRRWQPPPYSQSASGGQLSPPLSSPATSVRKLFTIDHLPSLKRTLQAQPRKLTTGALERPNYYIKCKCCDGGPNGRKSPNMQDACVLYQIMGTEGLAFTESKWYASFRAMAGEMTYAGGRGAQASEEGAQAVAKRIKKNWEGRELEFRFQISVHELIIAGLVTKKGPAFEKTSQVWCA